MTDHERFMRAALDEAALAAAEGEVPVGAVIVRENEIIARSHNCREQLHDPTAHAEMLAIREAARKLGTRRLNGCTLYVTLEPCPMCAGAMMMACLGRLLLRRKRRTAGLRRKCIRPSKRSSVFPSRTMRRRAAGGRMQGAFTNIFPNAQIGVMTCELTPS